MLTKSSATLAESCTFDVFIDVNCAKFTEIQTAALELAVVGDHLRYFLSRVASEILIYNLPHMRVTNVNLIESFDFVIAVADFTVVCCWVGSGLRIFFIKVLVH